MEYRYASEVLYIHIYRNINIESPMIKVAKLLLLFVVVELDKYSSLPILVNEACQIIYLFLSIKRVKFRTT